MCWQVVNCQYEEMSENVFQVKYEKSARHKGSLAVCSITAVSLVVCMKKGSLAVCSVTAVSLVVCMKKECLGAIYKLSHFWLRTLDLNVGR